MPKIIIVDKNDEIIDYKERGTLSSNEIYRSSALWIQNSNGDILLAQRSFNKKKEPGKWGPAVAGTIEENETYETNIIKETEEEIGLKNQVFQKTKKVQYTGKHNFFCQWYKLVIDKPISEFTIQIEEVEQIKWFKKDELLEKLNQNPNNFLESTKDCIRDFA